MNEACQLWLQQEVEAGLKEGKKPYTLGKEISKAIAKHFETYIKPETIEKRAERIKKENPTNVGKKSKAPINKGSQKFKSGRGGKRPGAGRKKEETTETPFHENIVISDALSYSYAAIHNLKSIQLNDPKRQEALDKVETWIIENR